MTATPLEDQLAAAGVPYKRRHDIAYRAGLVLQALGAGALAVLYPMANPFYSAGIMLFDLGVLLSALFLLVWISWVRKIIRGAVLIGIPVQIVGLQIVPPQYAGAVILIGIGLVCVGAAGIAGKEAYCFSFREGWALMWSLPVVIIGNLIAGEHHVINSLAFSTLFLLLLSLAGKKLKQPLLTPCTTYACEPSEKNSP